MKWQKAGLKPGLSNLWAIAAIFFRSSGYGRTPMIRAPMKANAAQIINALIGLVSPMS
jgi:hypothetical protein